MAKKPETSVNGMKNLLTPEQVAKVLSLGVYHVRSLIRSGEIPSIAIPSLTGRRPRRRVRPEDLAATIERLRR